MNHKILHLTLLGTVLYISPLLVAKKACIKKESRTLQTTNSRTLALDPAKTIQRSNVVNFTAATAANSPDVAVAVDGTSRPVVPPNAQGAIGTTQYIMVSQPVIRSFDKSTYVADGVLNISAASFFGEPVSNIRIAYNNWIERWMISAGAGGATPTKIVLAVSQDNAITTATLWDFFVFESTLINASTSTIDYPQLAFDKNATYLTTDAYDGSNTFLGSTIISIPNTSISNYASGTLDVGVATGVKPGTASYTNSKFSTPVQNFDTNPTYGYIVNALSGYITRSAYSNSFLYRIKNPTAPDSTVLSSKIALSNSLQYTDPQNVPHLGNKGGSQGYLQTNSCKIQSAVIRNKQLYTCQTIKVDKNGTATISGDRTGILWAQYDLTGDTTGQGRNTESDTTVPALVQWGVLYDTNTDTTSPIFYFNPSITVNADGNLYLLCNTAGANAYINAAYTWRAPSDTKSRLRAPSYLTSNSNSYNFGQLDGSGQGWGKISSIAIEPAFGQNAVATIEWPALLNAWGVQVASLN